MAVRTEKIKFMCVSANTTETDETYVPDDGVEVLVYEVGGNGVHNNEVKVEICFDTTCLFCTHGDSHLEFPQIITGDGSSAIEISLVNDSSNTETVGGYYRAVEL